MCGIVAYIGSKQAQNLLLEGLKRLEYRGYDSAGIAILEERPGPAANGAAKRGGGAAGNGNAATIHTARSVGRVSALEDRLEQVGGLRGTLGLAHTRWATHGGVCEANAHPHKDDKSGIHLVHNGIIEN